MKTATERAMHAQEALQRAQSSTSIANHHTVYAALAEAGLTGVPGVDVLTFQAWRATNRMVRKGEKALCFLVTVINGSKKTDDGDVSCRIPRRVAVFHVSQTDGLQ